MFICLRVGIEECITVKVGDGDDMGRCIGALAGSLRLVNLCPLGGLIIVSEGVVK